MINDERTGLIRKERTQNNWDSRFFASSTADDSILTCLGADRSPQKCERYSLSELTLQHADDFRAVQTLYGETSTISDVRREVKATKAQMRELRKKYSQRLQAEWRRLLAQNKLKKVRWVKTVSHAFRKEKYRLIPTGKTRAVMQKVELAPRPVRRFRKKVVLTAKGERTIREQYIDWNFRPHVWRVLLKPVFLKLTVRKPGIYPVTVRKRKEIDTYNWPVIRSAYIVYKGEQRDKLTIALAPLQARLLELYHVAARRMQQPHRLIAFTNAGWVPPSWKEYYYQHHRDRAHYDTVYSVCGVGHRWLWYGELAGYNRTWSDGRHCLSRFILVHPDEFTAAAGPHGSVKELKDACALFERAGRFSEPVSTEARNMLYPATVVDRLKLLDATDGSLGPIQTDLANQRDEQSEAQAVSSVESLRNSGDYTFNLPRSIGELKDSRETFKQGYDFLRWFAKGTRTRMSIGTAGRETFSLILERTGSASLALIAGYLAWKFAIQPTIQDCVTFREHTAEWLRAQRRALMEAIETTHKLSSTIYHARAKFRGSDAARQKSLQNVPVDVESQDVIVEMTTWTHNTIPAPIGITSSRGEGYMSDLNVRVEVPGFSLPPLSERDPVVTPNPDPTWGGAPGSWDIRFPERSVVVEHSTGDKSVTAHSDARDFTNSDVAGWTLLFDGRRSPEWERLISNEAWPKAPVVGYLKNQVEGVAFARYQIADLLAFLEEENHSTGLESLAKLVTELLDWDKLFDSLYQKEVEKQPSSSIDIKSGTRFMASWDILFVAWQLTPLSFIYDWFTTSESIVSRLNNFAVEFWAPAPPSLEGIWVTKRCELLAGRPGLEIVDSEWDEYVSDWWGGGIKSTTKAGTDTPTLQREYYWAVPRRIVRTRRLRYRSDNQVALCRSGLYAAKRGEHVFGGWETFLPKPMVKLNTGKLVTLLGILAGFIAPK